MKIQIAKGRTEVILVVFIQDSTSTTGAGLSGLTSSSGITGGFVRMGEAGIALAVNQTATAGSYTDPGAGQVGIATPANMRPGVYELHFNDQLWADGADMVTVSLGGAANMAPLILEAQLTDWSPNHAGWAKFFEALDAVDVDTAGGSGTATITLGPTNVAANIHQWKKITIISGPGAGQSRIILSNTAGANSVATVDSDWIGGNAPDNTSRYRIEDTALSRLTNSTHGGAGATITIGSETLTSARVANLSEITATRLAELDATNIPQDVDAILTDTADMQPKLGTLVNLGGGATIANNLADLAGPSQGATFSAATDSQEAIRDQGDLAWITGGGAVLRLQTTTIATLASQTSFTLTAGSADDTAYQGCMCIVTDQSTSTQKAVGLISAYTGVSRTVTLADDPGVFTMAIGDTVDIVATALGGGASNVNARRDYDGTGYNKSNSTIGTASAATAISTGGITAGSFAAGAIDAAAVANGAIDAATFAAGAIDAAAIANGAIDAATFAAGAIDAAAIADNAIDAGAIATDAITASKIAADAITSAKIANDAITAAKIAADAITSAKIALDAITSTGLAQSAREEIADAVWDENIVAAHGSPSAAGLLLRVLGAAISTRTNNATLNALLGVADIAANDIPAEINAEVVDALSVDTYAEPGSVPAATATLAAKLGWLAALARNRVTQTNTTQTLRNSTNTANIGTAAVSDDGVEFVRGTFS